MNQITRLVLALSFFISSSALFSEDCKSVATYGEGERWDCTANDKSFHVLRLKGDYAVTLGQHLALMSKEIAEGPLSEVVDELRANTSKGSLASRKLKSMIFNCYSSRIRESVSKEFSSAIEMFADQLHTRIAKHYDYTRDELRDAVYAIELSIAFEGLFRRLEEDKLGVIAELGATCGIKLSLNAMNEVLGDLASLGKMKMGCLGFVADEASTRDGHLRHARNFDANLVKTWERHPTFFLVEEPGFYKYVAVASAGVVYPGGISGMNEQGISVSLHEMSTTKYRTKHSGRAGELAPYLQQRILRETKTLDEAILLVQKVEHFGGWTILVSDAKNDESASIEMSGDKVQVARRRKASPLGQSNHFLGSAMKNQYFTYSFGKDLESTSRLLVIEKAMRQDAGTIDTHWMIDHLANHQDAFEGFRAFGRTGVKAYNVMSTVAIPDLNEFWFTISDRRPAAHGTYVGMQIDFNKLNFTLLGTDRTKAYDHLPNWTKSLEAYGNARMEYETGKVSVALQGVQNAMALAQQDAIDEHTYRYVRGRLFLELGQFRSALNDFQYLWDRRSELHPHKVALIALYSTAAIRGMTPEAQKQFKPQIEEQLGYAKKVFSNLHQNTPHFDLKSKIEKVSALSKNKKVSFGKIDFVTVE